VKFDPIILEARLPAELGYSDSPVVRVLANPTNAVYEDYLRGGTEATPGEVQQRALHEEVLVLSTATDIDRERSQAAITTLDERLKERRDRLGRAFHTFFGTTDPKSGFDFTSPETALQTIERDDLPRDVINWLWKLPNAAVNHRNDLLIKTVGASFASIRD
jgi:hypothetical protein